MPRADSVGSFLAVIWFLISLSVVLSPFERKDARQAGIVTGEQRFHISSRQTFHFQFKKETALPWLELPFADTAQLFLRLYRISALLCESLGRREGTGDPPETVRCFTHSSINRLPCSLQMLCLLARFNSAWAHSRQLSGLEKKTSGVAKKSWIGGCFLWGEKTRLSSPP